MVWAGKDQGEATLPHCLAWLGSRRARAIQVVWYDMRRPHLVVLRTAVPQATVVFDRFPVTQHAIGAVDTVRWKRKMRRQLAEADKPDVAHTRVLWLKNPENLEPKERTRLSGVLGGDRSRFQVNRRAAEKQARQATAKR